MDNKTHLEEKKKEFLDRYFNRTFSCVGGCIEHSVDKTTAEYQRTGETDLTVEELWQFIEQLVKEEVAKAREEDSRGTKAVDVVMSDEDGERFWISSEHSASFEEAYEFFIAYWVETGMGYEYWPCAGNMAIWTGRWREDEGEGMQEWVDDVNGEEWYYIGI
jgi:hypothetical protein